ncbi:Curli production assembly/transport component CsgG [Rhodomicrobium vannielii ATCC 17100]|uniref:Curli production assembly/transport component CsgG n=1 Tax=Rhodomicrobium vannielii (strain ATCC 17100 / DSM 162 / LMG 4299 / NCIMB 10020 / ATH 3.1.1) TaxID=648757 RepID=E3I1Z2_RHOVT|nr:CsgG/HfaB family protein [Rhodomicrobium vannielii]ADP71293.1 Curli production assembly/transport component CsgG [Rhodomicrobium vannielii ATCC 17100]
MRIALSLLASASIALSAGGCADYSYLKDQIGETVAAPNTGLLPPTVNPINSTNSKLRELPPPKAPVAVAVYGYGDQTGQFKPVAEGANVQSLSRAVTQGATSILMKALQDAGNGRWFTVVERERLDNLLKERRIIADMRQRYLGEQVVDPAALPPLLFAGVLIDGGIIGYDSNTKTGGAGAKYFGIGGDVKYSEDTVTVYLRATSVKTGQVLLSVVANKTILSYGVQGSAFRFVTYNRLFEAEGGLTMNEPGSLAVEQAIEKAVLTFIVEGSARGLWSFQDKTFQSRIIQDYELNYLQTAQANAGVPQSASSGNGGAAKTAVAANGAPKAGIKPASAPKPATAQVRSAAATASQAKPVQWAALQAPATQGAGQPLLPPAPFVIRPRTLEDEAPIAPR